MSPIASNQNLLKDELTFTHKYGKTEFYAGHRGSLSSFFAPHHYTTNYDDLATEFGFQGTTQNNRYDYRFSILPIVDHGKIMLIICGGIYL